MKQQFSMSDEKLIQFYLNGDPNALATLIELYKDRIYAAIYSIVQDKYAAEEIFRKVFTRIINNLILGKFDKEADFLQSAIQISNSLCIEYSKKVKHAIVISPEKREDVSTEIWVPVTEPQADYFESHGKIKSMIDMLPDEQREVIILNHYVGLSFKEIADTMKCSLSTALDRMKFGLNNLWKIMTEKEIVLQ